MEIFTNSLDLPELVIKFRVFAADPAATAITYVAPIIDEQGIPTGYRNLVGITSSVLTSQQIENSLANPVTEGETSALNRAANARSNAANIPDWATHTEPEALNWLQINIGDPLNAPIPTAAQFGGGAAGTQIRGTFVALVAIMQTMYQVLRAFARLLIAIRDDRWPNLSNG